MAVNKYYAVRKGLKTGIFTTWDECKLNVIGYPGAEYKSFPTKEAAEQYIGTTDMPISKSEDSVKDDGIHIYVDGSFCEETNEFSYGMVVLENGEEHLFSEKFSDEDLASMRNVAGEIKGAEAAMRYALTNNISQIKIYHDYDGIAKWCTGEWKANKSGTQKYRDYYNDVKDKIDIIFVKVKGHSNDKYNDKADELAKAALGIKK